jgi:hypothetical protein
VRILPVLLLYLVVIATLYMAALIMDQNWLLYLLYRYRLILVGIGAFLFIFAAGEINNLRRR